MTIQKANLNFGQLSLGEEFELQDDAQALNQAQRNAREEAARGALAQLYKGNLAGWKGDEQDKPVPPGGKPPEWMNELLYLLDHGWPWRQAVYVAWAASPRTDRWPDSQEELATQVLGLTSDRVMSEWRRKNPAIEAMIASLQSAKLMNHVGDVFAALKKSASNPDYKHHPDRKLLLEMTGHYTPVSQIRALIASGQLRTKNDVSDMSDADLLAMVINGEFAKPQAEPDPNAG